jgi:ribonuclease D
VPVGHNPLQIVQWSEQLDMQETIWIASDADIAALGTALAAQTTLGIDTEFMRERTFFPQLCLLQISSLQHIWLIDTLAIKDLAPLLPALTSPNILKLLHSGRQDLEALYLATGRIAGPIFDTQIAAACIGLRPQIGFAELVETFLGVALDKGQTRTDWSKRPLSPAQLAYAADDVRHLAALHGRLVALLAERHRAAWAIEDCQALTEPALYEPEAAAAWRRLKGLPQLAPRPRAIAKAVAIWREAEARRRNRPRSWVLPDAAVFNIAMAAPTGPAEFVSIRDFPADLGDTARQQLAQLVQTAQTEALQDAALAVDAKPTPEERRLQGVLSDVVDARAKELGLSPEVLAPRGELKALVQGDRNIGALSGWRRVEIGEHLLQSLESR